MDQEEIKRELTRCWLSPVYFTEKFVRIYNATIRDWIPFEMWPAQREALGQIMTSQYVIVLKARQLGMSWLCLSFALWLMLFRPIANIMIMSKRDEEIGRFADQSALQDAQPAARMDAVGQGRTRQCARLRAEQRLTGEGVPDLGWSQLHGHVRAPGRGGLCTFTIGGAERNQAGSGRRRPAGAHQYGRQGGAAQHVQTAFSLGLLRQVEQLHADLFQLARPARPYRGVVPAGGGRYVPAEPKQRRPVPRVPGHAGTSPRPAPARQTNPVRLAAGLPGRCCGTRLVRICRPCPIWWCMCGRNLGAVT